MLPGVLYTIALLGMFSHFLKKKVRGESITAIKKYFKDHFKSTALAFISTSVGFAAYMLLLQTGLPADIFAVFGIGFMSDSMFNRYQSEYPL